MIELNCEGCGKLLRIPDEYRGTTGKCNGCGGPVYVPADALTAAQKSLLANITSPLVEVLEEDWRNDPASPKQLSYLTDLGATPSMLRGLSKGRASEMIEELQEVRSLTQDEAVGSMAASQREMVNAQREVAKAIQRQTNSHKNACGCLILLLTAPLWVPVLLALIGSQ